MLQHNLVLFHNTIHKSYMSTGLLWLFWYLKELFKSFSAQLGVSSWSSLSSLSSCKNKTMKTMWICNYFVNSYIDWNENKIKINENFASFSVHHQRTLHWSLIHCSLGKSFWFIFIDHTIQDASWKKICFCIYVRLTIYSSEHGFFLTLVGWGQRTALIASSNTVFRPRWVKAEHSRYFTASIHPRQETHNTAVIILIHVIHSYLKRNLNLNQVSFKMFHISSRADFRRSCLSD